MNTAICITDLLSPSFADFDAAAILAHFRTRTHVRYFPVIADSTEVTREKMNAVLEGRFEFNGETHFLGHDFDWMRNPSTDLEWLILLHKFYYVAGLGAAYSETGDVRYVHQWTGLTQRWIEAVPVDFLSSDVAGRRIQNWAHAHYFFVTASAAAPIDPEFYVNFLRSLHEQVSWLRDHLTAARNHRTLELAAIFIAAVVFPEFREAASWLRFAIDGLLQNVRADLLPDGVQCELSTDYHHIVLRNYLVVRKLAAMNRIELPADMESRLYDALQFAKWAHRPDGTIPSLSDGDTGSFLDLLEQGYELFHDPEMLYVATGGRAGRAPGERLRAFDASGYLFMRSGWGDGRETYESERYLVFDCGPLGAGNHGHLDLLSFEAFGYGRPLIVDPGRYTYNEEGGWRALFRGTRYHNTVTVDGRNQARYEFDKTRFKVRGPEPVRELQSFTTDDEIDCLRAVCRSHEYDAVHERRIIFVRGEYWVISDFLTADTPHDYDAWFHLPAEAQECLTLYPYSIAAPSIVIAQERCSDVYLSVEPGFVSPKYGFKNPAPIIRLHRRGCRAAIHAVLYPYRCSAPRIRLDRHGEGQLRITVYSDERTFFDRLNIDTAGAIRFEREILTRPAQSETQILQERRLNMHIRNRRFLVTGGAGFIGSHVVDHLLESGAAAVTVIDDFNDFYAPHVKEANIAGHLHDRRYRLERADIRDHGALETAFRSGPIDVIVHLAARAGVRPSLTEPRLYEQTNIAGTLNLLEQARKRNIREFVFASSSSVYGPVAQPPFREDAPLAPISPYAATKAACELMAHTYSSLYGLRLVCLRFFTVYGARQRPDLAIHKFARLIASGKPIPVFGDGSTERDYTYIDDILQGIDGAIRYAHEGSTSFEIINLGESQTVALSELISYLEDAMGRRALIDRRPPQPGDMPRTHADISKARNLLGYRPATPIRAGIRNFVEWFERSQHAFVGGERSRDGVLREALNG